MPPRRPPSAARQPAPRQASPPSPPSRPLPRGPGAARSGGPPAGVIRVGVIMGSRSDWPTLEPASKVLTELGVAHEVRVVSAHRTPDLLFEYAARAEARGLRVIIAGAGGAAHLPGMAASKTALPVLGVPVQSHALHGLDSLLSIVQMPAGVPVGTLAIGPTGATNAGLLAASIIALDDEAVRRALHAYRAAQTRRVLDGPDPRLDAPVTPEAGRRARGRGGPPTGAAR